MPGPNAPIPNNNEISVPTIRSKIILVDILANTLDEAFNAEPISSKVSRIEDALKILDAKINNEYPELNLSSQEMIGMIVMPENYFSNSAEPGKSRQYSEQEAREIEVKLAALSAQYPKILLVTSIAWKKSIFYNNATSRQKLDVDFYKSDKAARGITTGNHAKYVKKCRQGDVRLKKTEEIIDGSAGCRFDYSDSNKIPSNEPSMKLRQLKNQNRYEKSQLQVSRNTIRFFLNGKQVGKVHKGSDFQEVLNYSWNIFLPGNATPVVSIDNHRIGVEVCSDHYFKLLKNAYKDLEGTHPEKAKERPDIHLLLSAWAKTREENVEVKDGGFLIHSSTNEDSRTYRQYSSSSEKNDLTVQNADGINIITLEFPPQPVVNNMSGVNNF